MKRFWILSATAVVISLGIWMWRSQKSSWQIAMEQSPTITIYELMPYGDIDSSGLSASKIKAVKSIGYMDRFRILGKTSVSDEADKDQIIAAFRSSFASGSNYTSSCFNPRQAIATANNKIIVLICFECGYAQVKENGKSGDLIEIGDGGQSSVKAMWQKYGLKSTLNLRP